MRLYRPPEQDVGRELKPLLWNPSKDVTMRADMFGYLLCVRNCAER